MLSVYVDDLKAAGPKHCVNAMWKKLSKLIEIEPPTKLGRYLGCEHSITEECIDAAEVPWSNLPGMRSENTAPGAPSVKKVRVINYDMCSYVEQSLEAYEELAGDDFKPYRKSSTPFVADDDDWPEDDKEGVLAPIALKVVMKVLYCARFARPDILRAICKLGIKMDPGVRQETPQTDVLPSQYEARHIPRIRRR